MSKTLSNSLPTPAFDDGKHHIRLYHGDCLELLAQIPESSVDLVFANRIHLAAHVQGILHGVMTAKPITSGAPICWK